MSRLHLSGMTDPPSPTLLSQRFQIPQTNIHIPTPFRGFLFLTAPTLTQKQQIQKLNGAKWMGGTVSVQVAKKEDGVVVRKREREEIEKSEGDEKKKQRIVKAKMRNISTLRIRNPVTGKMMKARYPAPPVKHKTHWADEHIATSEPIHTTHVHEHNTLSEDELMLPTSEIPAEQVETQSTQEGSINRQEMTTGENEAQSQTEPEQSLIEATSPALKAVKDPSIGCDNQKDDESSDDKVANQLFGQTKPFSLFGASDKPFTLFGPPSEIHDTTDDMLSGPGEEIYNNIPSAPAALVDLQLPFFFFHVDKLPEALRSRSLYYSRHVPKTFTPLSYEEYSGTNGSVDAEKWREERRTITKEYKNRAKNAHRHRGNKRRP